MNPKNTVSDNMNWNERVQNCIVNRHLISGMNIPSFVIREFVSP